MSTLKEYISKVIKEQIDLRTKDGRELKEMMQTLLSKREELENFSASIENLLSRQKDLQKEVTLAHKVLFNRMEELEQKTLRVAETVAEIVEEPKYKRVEPTYKDLYQRAVESLARFSQEQSNLIEGMKQAEIVAKKAMTTKDLKIKKVQTEQFEPFKEKLGSIVKKLIAFLFGKFSKVIKSADDALVSLEALKNAQ